MPTGSDHEGPVRGLVVDASVVVSAIVDSAPDGRWAEQALGESALVAPELMIVEALNIVRRLEQAGELSALEAASAESELQDLPVDLMPVRPFAERIWQLRHNVTCYDAWYVAIAEALELPLATLNRRLKRAHGPECEVWAPPE